MTLHFLAQTVVTTSTSEDVVQWIVRGFAAFWGVWMLKVVNETRDKVHDIRAALFGPPDEHEKGGLKKDVRIHGEKILTLEKARDQLVRSHDLMHKDLERRNGK